MEQTLYNLRRKAGYKSQEEFCAASGLGRGLIAKWEAGIRYPAAKRLPDIARLLNVTEGEVIAAITASKTKAKNERSETP